MSRSSTRHSDATHSLSLVFPIARILIGWTFLWVFLDKFFGLGRGTPSGSGWIDGGHPTKGYLQASASGPLEGFYRSIAGAPWADALFVFGSLAIGVAFLLGIGLRIATASGVTMMLMLWAAVLPPKSNPVTDLHIVVVALLLCLACVPAGERLGLARWWTSTSLVRKYPILR